MMFPPREATVLHGSRSAVLVTAVDKYRIGIPDAREKCSTGRGKATTEVGALLADALRIALKQAV